MFIFPRTLAIIHPLRQLSTIVSATPDQWINHLQPTHLPTIHIHCPNHHLKSLAEHAITRAPIEKKYRDINLSYREINAKGWFLWYSRLERETLMGYVLSFFCSWCQVEGETKAVQQFVVWKKKNNNRRYTPAGHQPHQSAVAVSISSLFIYFLFTFCPIPQRLSL